MYLLEVDVVRELHVLRVDAKNLETTSRVWDANVDFAIEATETTKGRVDGIGAVGGGHNDDVRASLKTVHESEELRNDATFDFSVSLQANKEAMSILKCIYTHIPSII